MNCCRSVLSLLTLVLVTTAALSFAAPVPAGLPPAPLPQTGQTGCWATDGSPLVCATDPLAKGQDGALRMGVVSPTPRFTVNMQADGTTPDGTVTDNLTGLVWLQNHNCIDSAGGVDKTNGYLTWNDAVTWSSNLSSATCGLFDGSTSGQWRLPTVRELESLVDLQNSNPALPVGHPFGAANLRYWSSSTSAHNADDAWLVYMDGGYVDYDGKGSGVYVWPVRAGQ